MTRTKQPAVTARQIPHKKLPEGMGHKQVPDAVKKRTADPSPENDRAEPKGPKRVRFDVPADHSDSDTPTEPQELDNEEIVLVPKTDSETETEEQNRDGEQHGGSVPETDDDDDDDNDSTTTEPCDATDCIVEVIDVFANARRAESGGSAK